MSTPFKRMKRHAAARGMTPAGGRARAFTIIELIVVILIVSVLASILIPYIRKNRETDKRVRCSENLRAIGVALQAYAKANDGGLPRVVHDVANNPGGY